MYRCFYFKLEQYAFLFKIHQDSGLEVYMFVVEDESLLVGIVDTEFLLTRGHSFFVGSLKRVRYYSFQLLWSLGYLSFLYEIVLRREFVFPFLEVGSHCDSYEIFFHHVS